MSNITAITNCSYVIKYKEYNGVVFT